MDLPRGSDVYSLAPARVRLDGERANWLPYTHNSSSILFGVLRNCFAFPASSKHCPYPLSLPPLSLSPPSTHDLPGPVLLAFPLLASRPVLPSQHLKEQHVRPRANMMGCDARHRGVRPREKWRTGDAPTGTTGRHAGSPNGRDPGKGSTRWFLPKKKKKDLGFAASQLPHLGRSWSVLPKPPPPVLPSLPAVWDA
jgi:hypothetical protein